MAYRLDIKRILSMNFFHDLPQIMLGCALAAIATDLFLIPNGLAAGGVTGLATIIQAVGAARGLSLPVGNQKQVGRDGGQGTPQHDLGQVVKEVHRKNALDVKTICHAASLKKAHPNGCAFNFLLYSILPIRRTKTTPAQGLLWIQNHPARRVLSIST